MQNTLRNSLIIASILFSNSSFSQSDKEFTAKELNRELVMATLWVEVSGEFKALAHQAFNIARFRLEQFKTNNPSINRFAVVVDVDETVISNKAYEAHLINEGVYHSSALQKIWADEAIAPALPGAVEFLNYAKEQGAEVFYVTNRKENTREGTLKNLKMEGFPFADSDHLLVKTDTSNKQPRRNAILREFEIALLIGDNLRDFSEEFHTDTLKQASEVVESKKDLFGSKYIVLPNPMYGDWEGKTYGGNWRLPAKEKSQLRHDSLDAWQPKNN